MGCLSVLATGTGQEAPEVLYRIIFGRPLFIWIMRIIHTTVRNHLFPLLEGALPVLTVLAILTF